MEITTELARRLRAIRYEDLPHEVVRNAKGAILDTIGVTIAGSQEDCATRLMRVPGMSDAGPSLVFGHRFRTSALNAALVNGTSAHALDFDDVNIALGGHPSAPLVPALFALADITDASGKDLIAAFVAGFETTTRIGRSVNFHHYEKGWHPTVTIGVFGAAAASAHLLRLTEGETAVALAIAVSLASGVKANFGTMTKPLHVGHCARSGMFAAFLAREGYTANPLAFEHKQGYFNVFNGAGTFDAERIFAEWARPYDIERPGLGIKLYPCCGSTHCAIDGTLTLAAKYAIKPQDVERVDVRVHARRLVHINRPEPQSGLDAKFSLQYCVARALTDGKVIADHFEGEAFRDSAVRALAAKVHPEPYTNTAPDLGDHYRVEFAVTLRSGTKHTHTQERPCGRSPEDPTPPERLEAKFVSCAARVLDDDAVTKLLAALRDLENAPQVRDVASLITPPR